MNVSKTLSALRKINLHYCRNSVVQCSVIKRSSSSANESSVGEPELQASYLGDERKEMKGPLIKNFFAGIFDEALLEYPEYPSLEYIKELKGMTDPVEDYFLNCVDSKVIDERQEIPKDILDSLKEHKLYALTVPRKFGGLQIDDRCFARYCEAVGSDMSVSTYLAAHYRTLYTILLHGSEEQKTKYLDKLASGDMTFGFCMLEKNNIFDAGEFDTVALPKENGDWVINGKKIWVVNGSKADSYVLFAKTWAASLSANNNSLLTVFLVDRNSPGVKCGPALEQLGTRGVEICDVTFDNVTVKKENMLGEPGIGSEIAFECLSRSRLGAAASAVGFLKNLLNLATDYVINTNASGKALSSFEYTQRHLGSLATDIYALESMVYLTAGLKDTFKNPDLSIEEAIVKVYSMEKIVEIVDVCANMVGGYAYIKGSPFENFIRDSRSYLLHDIVPVSVTKIFIASLGLQHAGMQLQDDIKKSRNPFDFPSFVLKNMWKERNACKDDLKIPGVLKLQLHPSLSGEANKVEDCLLRLEYVVKNLLRRWGIEVVDRQVDLMRLADCAISMYAMSAVISRASRSYCIGFGNSDCEVAVANVFCSVHQKKVKNTVDDLLEGPVETNDRGYLMVGEKVVSNKGYFFEHPIARNY